MSTERTAALIVDDQKSWSRLVGEIVGELPHVHSIIVRENLEEALRAWR